LDDRPSLLESLDPRTIRAIGGILLFVFALLLLLSALGLAGPAGTQLYAGLYWLIGVGYFIVPFLLVGATWMLFNPHYAENTMRPIRMTGAGLLFVSTLTLVGAMSPEHAGVVGKAVASPLVQAVDLIATVLVLCALLLVSLLLLLDSELWVSLWHRLRSLVRSDTHTPSVENTGLDPVPDTVDELPTPQEPEAVDPEQEEPEEEYAEADDEADAHEALEAPEPVVPTPKKKERAPAFEPPTEYNGPPVNLLESDKGKPNTGGDTKMKSNIIRKTLQHFKIPVEMDEVTVGPSVTRYALKPAAGVKLNKITSLQPNLELALAASPLRIEAPIPGKSLVGIEVPNTGKSIVGLGGLLGNSDFTDETVPLYVALGKDITGTAHYANIAKMPHCLVAGTTGSGKSVMIHSIVTSLLYRNSPERLKLIMIDPKRVELTLYDGIPHLMTPVITDAKRCILALKWAAKEMDKRYDTLREHQMQDISGYHNEILSPAIEKYLKKKEEGGDLEKLEEAMPPRMPHIVIIIDELADIMSAYPRELEAAIVRLAQMSRAVGIHLILSTQRPEAKVITGLIKANIPTRIALKVSTLIDSRVILDQGGAEKLLGYGDMLYLSGDMSTPRRLQSPFLRTAEVKKVVKYIKDHNAASLDEIITLGDQDPNTTVNIQGGNSADGIDFEGMEQDDDMDELFEEVRAFVIAEQKASTSLIQRRFKVGYGRAARIMDQLEGRGVIESSDGTNRPRKVTISKDSAVDDTPYSSSSYEESDGDEEDRDEYETKDEDTDDTEERKDER